MRVCSSSSTREFQSTLPARGATGHRQQIASGVHISIHAPRTGSDGNLPSPFTRHIKISIHAPRTGSDRLLLVVGVQRHNFNPRSPHGERPSSICYLHQPPLISIHAPRTGSDSDNPHDILKSGYFNPRSPHGERLALAMWCVLNHGFQSTLPARGATRTRKRRSSSWTFQSTLPARGATPTAPESPPRKKISIHAPRTGSDPEYQSAHGCDAISIHAPRTGSDCRRPASRTSARYFNPRSPHGERPNQKGKLK